MEHEIWKPIIGYEPDYEVSNLGNVRSMRFANMGPGKKGSGVKNLKLILGSNGYYVVNLYKDGIMKQLHVHRLVAEAFLPNPQNFPVVDHINTITTDNRICNLRWTTPRGNINNPISSERRLSKCRQQLKGKYGKDANKHRSIAQYTKDGVLLKVWGAMSDACRELGLDSGSLTRACQGINKTSGGFVWRYCEQQMQRTKNYR